MNKLKALSLLLAVLCVSLPGSSSADSRGECHCGHHSEDSLKLLRGVFSYQFSGEFGPESLSNTLVETGVFKADGRGHLSASATSIVNGSLQEVVTYKGTYTVEDRVAHVNVTRSASNSAPENLNFLLAIGEKTDTVFIQAETKPNSDFAFVNIIGSGRE